MRDHRAEQETTSRDHLEPPVATGAGEHKQLADQRAGDLVVQRMATVEGRGASDAAVEGAARAGTAGAGQTLPHLDSIQRSFGSQHDLSSVRAHVGGEAAAASERMGAHGFATGNQVAFKSSPDLRLAAHEAAHVVQQRSGVQLKSAVGQSGDTYERNADAVAERVVAGQPAHDLLPGGRQAASTNAVQRYTELGAGEQKDGNWTTGGLPVRVADDGNLAVVQESIYGSHLLYAAPSLIAAASAKLEKSESVIRLKAGGGSIQGKAPEGGGAKSLVQVVPENIATKTKGDDMELWADCGKSSSDVIGSGKGTGGGDRSAVYNDKNDQQAKTTWPGSPTYMKWEIMAKHFGDKIDQGKLGQLFQQFNATHGALGSAKDPAEKKKLQNQIALLEWKIENLLFSEYNKLKDDEKTAFDKKVGINRFAAPEVGQGYTMSTGGDAKPGYEKNTWNFHWAGVIMTSGGDRVTLENYAVGDPSVENTDWKIQMYGPPSKAMQTFHDQHKDVHNQHGDAPTTMTVEEKNKQP